jgi:Zn-dependent protease with chaperone function
LATGFFEQQDSARRISRRLIWLFLAAVIAIVVAVNAALGALYLAAFTHHGAWARYGLDALPHYFVSTTTGVVVLMIVGGTMLQMLDLREGGEAVARMVGGRLVDPSSHDQMERRLLNVIEEMALASGVPAPRVYVLERQDTINAFAAGLHPNDAVITVTHGTLTRLTRDELQGVIGHEFSHILNGDMTLNVRLIGLLHGLLILALFGRFLLDLDWAHGSTDRRSRSGVVAVAGIVILAAGYIGVFFGRLIKASVSRQRELLADASSVQFTRNSDGIGNALRKIGGLGEEAGGQIDHPHAETLSHMFMAPARPNFADGWLATHPPLKERIRRIFGRPMDFLPAPELVVWNEPEQRKQAPELAPLPFTADAAPAQTPAGAQTAGARASAAAVSSLAVSPVTGLVGAAAGAGVPAAIGKPHPGSRPFVERLLERVEALGLRPALSDTTGAQLLVLGLLVEQEQSIAARQEDIVSQVFGPNASAQVEAVRRAAELMPPGWRLPLVDLAMPALRKLPAPARDRLLALARKLIAADNRVTLPEFLLYTVLEARLGVVTPSARPAHYAAARDLTAESALVLSLLATVRMPEAPPRAYRAGAQLLEGMPAEPLARDALPLSKVSAAFHRLNLLAPLAKPQLIKACAAVTFVDGSTNWKAASCLRTLCAALDCPLPPQVDAEAEQEDNV